MTGVWLVVKCGPYKKGNIMEFTKDKLLIIEEALRTARDNAFDEDWYTELSEVLAEVRNELDKGE